MSQLSNWLKTKGPGALIAAAFIGPGTVTTCTMSGASYGYALLWVMLLSVLVTYVFQEMAVRMAIVTRKPLPGIISDSLWSPGIKKLLIGLILIAILFGNAAYEAGNITGAVLGMETLLPVSNKLGAPILGLCAAGILWYGNYQWLERILVTLVIVMSLCFVTAAIFSGPDMMKLGKSLIFPTIPSGSIFQVVALIGTTVVPYNLFLHASLGLEKWKDSSSIKDARTDAGIAIVAGGLISMAIMISAATSGMGEAKGVMDLAKGLENVFGSFARPLLGIGLFAAGLTSAITAPLAAAYVASACLGWKDGLKNPKFRMVWLVIIGIGVLFSTLGFRPLYVISFAQLANGVLLPVIAFMVIRLSGNQQVMGSYVNTGFRKYLSWVLFLIVLSLGLLSMAKGLRII